MSFSSLLYDRVTLVGSDGAIKKDGIPASVQKGKIIIGNEAIDIRPGDHLLRTINGGLVEDYLIEHPHYTSGGSLSHWEIEVRRTDIPASPPQTIINNLSGDNARVNINSTDNSVNISDRSSAVIFDQMIEASRQIDNAGDRQRIEGAIADMREAQGTSRFLETYKAFMSTASDHIGVYGPFLAGLASFLA